MPVIGYLIFGAITGAIAARMRPRETQQVLDVLHATKLDRVVLTVAAGALGPNARQVVRQLT
jgi:uncharacterized membrane protein YeaQ/YmgE (transglycosylase-associated protein family)